jgi:hybrid cluster-associated redox disulfide protein
MIKKITKEMTFGDVMERDPEAAFKLMDMGLMCGGCPIAQFETVDEGCRMHGVDVKNILKKLNEAPETGTRISDEVKKDE